ncbi:hypothetical protein PF008_g29491, partial [Phytophthora fragariae]
MIETTRYFYDDDVLAKMILAAEKNPSTKKLGQRVDEELMKRWTQGVYTPGLNKADEVFQSLKLDQLGDKVLAIPLFGYFSRVGRDELLLNKKKRMHLGYHAVKCRSQRELTKGTSIDKGVANELAFFGQHEYW